MWETRIYYANYLRYFEKSWFEYLAARGLSLVEWEKQGIFFIIKRVEVDYISPARYGEIIEVQTDVSEVTRASFTFHHRVILKDTGRLIAEGKNQMVCISAEGKLRRFPSGFLQRLQERGE